MLLFASTQWHTWFSLFPDYAKRASTSVPYTHWNALLSGTCVTYSSMSFKHLFTLTSKRFSLIILSKIVALYCNSPSPHRGLLFFIAYINTPTLHNITHSVYIQSSSIWVCTICKTLSAEDTLVNKTKFSPELALLWEKTNQRNYFFPKNANS